jgi:hypothetical protein
MKSGAYVSDVTQFIRELRTKNPQIAEQQKKNRATWWDRPQDLETWRDRAQAAVPQPGYVYFPLPRRAPDKPDESGNKVSNPSKPT